MKNFYSIILILTSTIVSYAQSTWTKLANHTDVTTTGTYMIVDVTSSSALTSANLNSTAPSAVAVTISENNVISGEIADQLQWKFEASGLGYIIKPKENPNNLSLNATNSNNGVRINSGSSNVWILNVTQGNYKGFQIPSSSNRYLGTYDNQDWRTYTSTTGNIATTQIEIFQLVENTTVDPTATFAETTLETFTYVFGEGPSSQQIITLTVENLGTSTLSTNFSNSDFQLASPITIVEGSNQISIQMASALSIGNKTGALEIKFGEEVLATLNLVGEVTDSPLSTEINNIEGLKVYPNPASDLVNIVSNEIGTKNVAIYDMLGKKVLETTTQETINVSDLNSGVYIMNITQDGKSASRKLVIK